jgi:ELWxxDGT repeat protein
VEGAHLNLGEAMTPISLNYTSQSGTGIVHNGNGSVWAPKDIAPGTFGSVTGGYIEREMIGLGDTVLFQAGSGGSGMQSNRELWKSDGTEAGTMQVKDINVGSYGSTPTYFTLMGETVFFAANAGPGSNSELWKTDGTETGTVLVKEINPANSIGGRMYDLTVV